MNKILVLFLTFVCLLVTACGSDESKKQDEKPALKVETEAAVATSTPVLDSAPVGDVDSRIAEVVQNAGANTSGAVDAITLMAKKDAKTAKESQIKEALDFIADNYLHCHRDNMTMEKTIYYGALLDAAFQDNDARSRVGWNAVKAVKYVYRGAEKPSDSAPQNALNKVAKELARI